MEARQLIGGASFSPDMLRTIYGAFDDAWGEVAAEVSSRRSAIDAARLSLATIVLSVARIGPIDRDSIRTAAITAFRIKHRIP